MDSSLFYLGIRELRALIARRKVSPAELVTALSARIAALNPDLNAYLAISDGLEDAAREAEKQARARRGGALLGVPISVKDIILTRDARTTAGSRLFGEGLPPTRDAPVVQRLRKAGAIIVGKVNLHEVAYGVTTVNEHFGAARNPWAFDRVSGGSSGGSAVAVAAGLCSGSVGTDTRGSIRIPAACCGVTGLKPTYGVISTEDVVPLSHSLDHVGPMGHSVDDVATLFGIMSGKASLIAKSLGALKGKAKGLRIGVSSYHMRDLDPEIERAIRAAADTFRRLGCTVTEVDIPELDGAQHASVVICSAEAAAYHEPHLRATPQRYGPAVRERLEKSFQWTGVDYVRAEQKQVAVAEAFRHVFGEVDCLLGGVLPAFPPLVGDDTVTVGGRETGVVDAFTRLNSPQNVAGVPALAIPCGFGATGLPIGCQLIAGGGREDLLFRAGALYQAATDWHSRRPPEPKAA
ncbi:MAG: amidase [Gemmatimonadota bacterium]